MAEENQVMKEPQQVTKKPQQITTKDPKKVEAGKRLAAINHKKREVKNGEEQVQLKKTTSRVNQYYGIGAVIAVGVVGGSHLSVQERPHNQRSQGCFNVA